MLFLDKIIFAISLLGCLAIIFIIIIYMNFIIFILFFSQFIHIYNFYLLINFYLSIYKIMADSFIIYLMLIILKYLWLFNLLGIMYFIANIK
jgi:hypothetical protein